MTMTTDTTITDSIVPAAEIAGGEPMEDGITISIASELTGRSKTTINNWARKGVIRTAPDKDGTRLVSEADVRAAAASHRSIDRKPKDANAGGERRTEQAAIGAAAEQEMTAHDNATQSTVAPLVPAEDQDQLRSDEPPQAVAMATIVIPDAVPLEEKVPLDLISFDEATQVRARILPQVIGDYSEKMKRGERFPLVELFRDEGGTLYIGDGWHRLSAAKKNGYHSFPARVYSGGKAAALRFALQANLGHGIRLTNADRRKKVLIALGEYPTLSNNAIAEACAVSEGLVRRIRDTFVKNEPATRTGSDGKQYPSRKHRQKNAKKVEKLIFKRTAKLTEKLTTEGLKQLREVIEKRLATIEQQELPAAA